MTRAEQLALIDRAFAALPDMDRGYIVEKERLYYMCLQSEQRHRKGRPAMSSGISSRTAARLFTVLLIARGLAKPGRYVIGDVLQVRIECLHAQALVERFADVISLAWIAAGIDRADVLKLDYAELMI